MLDQLTSLSSAIDAYKVASEWWNTEWKDIREVVWAAIHAVWNILWKNGIGAQMIIDSFERFHWWDDEKYRERVAVLQKAVTKWSLWEFSAEILSFFWVSNPEMFILRGNIGSLKKPIIDTKIKVSVILSHERKIEKRKPRKWSDLEWISAVLSSYSPTYEALMTRKSGIHNIIHQELIIPLAEEAPFTQDQFGWIIAWYEKKEKNLWEIEFLEKRVANIRFLKKKGINRRIQGIEKRISKEMLRFDSLMEELKKIRYPFSLHDIVPDIQKQFWLISRKNNRREGEKSEEIITSHKIRWRIRRGVSVLVHRKFEELRKIRVNGWAILRMIKMYEKITERHAQTLEHEEDIERKREVILSLKDELDTWEKESNELLEKYSLREIRILRDQIIQKLLSKN